MELFYGERWIVKLNNERTSRERIDSLRQREKIHHKHLRKKERYISSSALILDFGSLKHLRKYTTNTWENIPTPRSSIKTHDLWGVHQVFAIWILNFTILFKVPSNFFLIVPLLNVDLMIDIILSLFFFFCFCFFYCLLLLLIAFSQPIFVYFYILEIYPTFFFLSFFHDLATITGIIVRVMLTCTLRAHIYSFIMTFGPTFSKSMCILWDFELHYKLMFRTL